MRTKTDLVRFISRIILICFFGAVLLTVFSIIRNTASNWYTVLAFEQEPSSPDASIDTPKRENVLGAFTAFIISPTPTPTNTPTPSPTATPTPTPTNTPTPTPVPPTATPTPSPIPTRVPSSPAEIDEFFQRFSGEYGVEEELLRKIAYCESGYNAQSTNGDYGGMYQFSTTSWESTRIHMGADPNPDLRFNPEEAIRTASFKISVSGTGAWPTCGK
jgi:hypothetical protein